MMLRDPVGAGVVVPVIPALGEEKGKGLKTSIGCVVQGRAGLCETPISMKSSKREGAREQRKGLERDVSTASHPN